MACPFCSSPTRHAASCRRAWADRGRRQLRARAVERARQWLELFGTAEISPTGARLFAAVLEECKGLRLELAEARELERMGRQK
jgi:hypothetical protein